MDTQINFKLINIWKIESLCKKKKPLTIDTNQSQYVVSNIAMVAWEENIREENIR